MKCTQAAKRGLALAVVAVTLSSIGLAEDTTANAGALKTTQPAQSESKVFGTLDLRAEYYSSMAQYDTSDYAELGYQFNKDLKIGWYQGFDSNIYNSSYVMASAGKDGFAPMLDQSFLRTRVTNVWTNGDWALNYESRIYAPTWKAERDQGNITRLYNAFKLARKVNNTLTLTAVEVVAPQIFSVAGVGKTANPWYQNRVYLIGDINITSKLTLSIPVLLYTDFNREFAGADNSGKTTNLLYMWPELDYALNDHLTLGVAYVTGNMVKPDFSETTMGDAFKNSVVQAIVTTTL